VTVLLDVTPELHYSNTTGSKIFHELIIGIDDFSVIG
jgi:hypothetical protein